MRETFVLIVTLVGWYEHFVGFEICGNKDRPVLHICIGCLSLDNNSVRFSTMDVLRSHQIMNALILNKESSKHPSTMADGALENKEFD